jgi:hypothetical protein
LANLAVSLLRRLPRMKLPRCMVVSSTDGEEKLYHEAFRQADALGAGFGEAQKRDGAVSPRTYEDRDERMRRAVLLLAVIGVPLIAAAMLLAGTEEPTATVNGDSGDNRLTGTPHPDAMSGFGGRDTIYGGAGRDEMNGGPHNDTVLGGPGTDSAQGRGGDDHLYGGGGADGLFGNAGNDLLDTGSVGGAARGGPGNDTLVGGYALDRLDGGESEDRIYGASGDDLLEGGRGNDLLRGEGGKDSIFGQLGRDTMFGGDGDDFIDAVDRVPNEIVDCGPGINDMASADAGDVVVNCETP